MKRNTPDHWKMDDFASRLGICLAQAVGHLEMLFHLTAKQAIHGDIGKMPNASIAKKSGWDGDSEKFIEALIGSKWLDRCIISRLIVHDWHEHCDDATKKAVQRSGIEFKKPISTIPDNGGQRRTEPDTQSDNGVLPSLAQPCPAMPSHAMPVGDQLTIPREEMKLVDGQAPTPMMRIAVDMAQEFCIRIPGTSRSSTVEFAEFFKAKLEHLAANNRDETERIWAAIRDPQRDRSEVNTVNKLFKFWQFCGLEERSYDTAGNGRKSAYTQTARRPVTGGDAWGDAERYDGRNVPYLDHATGQIVTPATAG